ncbi:tyrosine recombinase XerC [Sutcliffiella cohnii]|uniref:tyrosine recombinase XerC n=1 Tax=Sutcliffiella cohnii TaxID=33932 RepID=UPI002E1ADEE6|nr:tyrosine recombinase XerC [Sutcliffiella cohnii]MED4015350.1 tyrosine recombinase XerC [Sutcliffiella cohnii]
MKNEIAPIQSFLQYLQVEKNYSTYTVEFYKKDIEDFWRFLITEGVHTYKEVSYREARVYLTKLYKEKYARKTVARKISSIRSFNKYLLREEKLKEDPFSLIHVPKQEQRLPQFLYEEEMEKLFTVSDLSSPIGQRDQAILEVLYGTGIRVSECCKIDLLHIDFHLGTILVHGKGSKQRYVPFGSFASEALNLYISDGRKKLLEKSRQNNQENSLFLNFRGGPLTPRGVRVILDNIVSKASTTLKISPHSLRHTFATHMLNEGADLRVVQELLGHAHLSSTQVYTHVTKEHLRKTYMQAHPRAKDGN